ncbi:MAG: hypothetical protein QOH71_2871 [Blastocatellia bacterium]|jgi:hypothetical protein|nr:hypothetical protein [Blastocatellia bacterium]
MDERKYPPGWDEKCVREVLVHYEQQTQEEAIAEDEAGLERNDESVIQVQFDLVPLVRELIAKRHD